LKRGKPQVGFSFPDKSYPNSLAAFLLTQQAQKKSYQKKTPKRIFASAEATNATRVGCAPPFKKGGRKLPLDLRRKAHLNFPKGHKNGKHKF